MLADADLPVVERIGEPARDHGAKAFVVADMGFVGADKINVGQFVRDNAQKVALNGVWVEIHDALAKIHAALAKLFIRWALDTHRPPFAV